jgi:hypothetical protein
LSHRPLNLLLNVRCSLRIPDSFKNKSILRASRRGSI